MEEEATRSELKIPRRYLLSKVPNHYLVAPFRLPPQFPSQALCLKADNPD